MAEDLNAIKKIDIHVHTRMPKGPLNALHKTYPTPEELIEIYKSYGIGRGIIMPGVNPEGTVFTQSNEDALDICRKYPDLFSMFVNLDPRSLTNSGDSDFTYLMSYYKERGALGVGEIQAHLPFEDERVLKLFADCEKFGFPVLFHMTLQQRKDYGLIDEPGLVHLEAVLKRFPNLTFLAHSQAFWAHIGADVTKENSMVYPKGKVIPGRLVELMRKYPNLCGDLSANSGGNAVMRDPEFGLAFLCEFQDKLYYGTDFCMPTDSFPLGGWMEKMCREGKLPQNVYVKIVRDNAKKLFGLQE